MKFDWGTLFGMALQTVPEPRKIAREVQGLGLALSHAALWQILALILTANAFLGVIAGILFPLDAAEYGPLIADPLLTAIVQASMNALLVFAIYWVGRAFGGTGSFEAALATVIWLDFVMLVIKLGVIFLLTFAPAFAAMLAVAGAAMGLWILSHFIAEMHGFASAGRVFAGMAMTMLVLVFVLSVIFAIIGVSIGLQPTAGTAQ